MKNENPMKKNGNPWLNLYDFHTLMEENNVALIYNGEFSQDFTKSMLAFMEKKFISEDMEDNLRRKIFNVMVEILQNLSKHRYQDSETGEFVSATFSIGHDCESYFIISGNPILNDKVESLKDKLDQVNALDKDGLKDLYKQVRLEGKFSEVSGAGIGLIDIARESGNKLGYEFKPLNDAISFFTMQVKISNN